MREAPSVVLANLLTQSRRTRSCLRPGSDGRSQARFGRYHHLLRKRYGCRSGCDALALITEWTEFRVPNWEKVGAAMKTKVVFDGRNLYRSAIVAEAGFDYYGIGM